MALTVTEIINKVDSSKLLTRPLSSWRTILNKECQVYVFGENYLAKRFDQINYKFCEKNEAKEILVDNLYALLRYNYFPQATEEIDKRIADIVASVTANLKTTLLKISFDINSDTNVLKMLPDYCVAFRNGVYDFKEDKWLFKYKVVSITSIANKIYIYDDKYAIFWYLDYDFEPLPIHIMDTPLKDFLKCMMSVTKTPNQRNFCTELLYNISHDSSDMFDMQRFRHLCEILGYTLLQSFSQYFVLLIGSGQNGKNSLFDGCFTNRVIPRPAANDLDAIENDRFITGALENKSHNIFLETSAKTYTESKMIKALTGSMYQTIESKGISKYSGVINCKYIFAGNDQDRIKFSDNTNGFRRRINMFEVYYQWDSGKRFLKRGDYFDTTFSDTLNELKDDVANTTAYVYFAMYGILSATSDFTKNFKFTMNDWNYKYSDIDVELKDKVEHISITKFLHFIHASRENYEFGKESFFDIEGRRLYLSRTMKQLGYVTYEDMLKMFEDREASSAYFTDNDVYVSLRLIQLLIKDISAPMVFTQTFKKVFLQPEIRMFNSNKPYIKCSFMNRRLKVIK